MLNWINLAQVTAELLHCLGSFKGSSKTVLKNEFPGILSFLVHWNVWLL